MKISKYEARAFRKKKLDYDLRGKGLFVYRNAKNSDLMLPKPDENGSKVIGPGQEFQGSDYFMSLVKTNEARLVRTLIPVEMENNTMTEKLILDQPETVTTEGTVEQVVENPPIKKLNETPTNNQIDPEVLINEDPMEGVVID